MDKFSEGMYRLNLTLYRVAAINPEFFSSYFQMTQHRWKKSELIEVKTNLYWYISRIILFIKTAVSIKGSLDPGPQALADLLHSVPVEGPHHLLYLLDQILGFVARLCHDPYVLQIRHTQKSEKSYNQVSWEARPPPPTPPHSPQLTIRPAWARPASSCFRRQVCHPVKRSNVDFQLSKCILRHHFLINLLNFLLPSLTVLLLMFPKAINFYHGTSGAKPRDYPSSYAFLLIHFCQNVTICFYLCFSRQRRRFYGKN